MREPEKAVALHLDARAEHTGPATFEASRLVGKSRSSCTYTWKAIIDVQRGN